MSAIAAGLLLALTASAQESYNTSNGPGRTVAKSDQLFRKTIWRQLDLREKQNKPMFASGQEISRILIEAVKRGELMAYENDSLQRTLTPRQVVRNMSYAEERFYDEDYLPQTPISSTTPGNTSFGRWGISDDGSRKAQPRLDSRGRPVKDSNGQVIMEVVLFSGYEAPEQNLYEYRYKDLYELELREDAIFDKRQSRMTYEIKSLTLHVPAALPTNIAGIERPVASFRYSDVVRVFRANPETAVWFNTQNEAASHNLADAFALRLFSSYVTKISNPYNQRFDELAGYGSQSLKAASKQTSEMLEYEYNLWSF
ncbi:gliding motility protein GldN [Hymenobacter saemangeumensis]|uniref:type IX secretion system ring protein PorN/GldN n=1 Tax=Hymenobacter saemangeumensis TaxID=1084522 RepID=UPI0031E63B79